METALERQFASVRKALKVLSLAALVPALVYFFVSLSFVSKSQRLFSEMLPEGTALPHTARWAIVTSDLLSSNLLYIAPLALAGIGCCVWVTVRDKGGHFLYLNLGLCLLLMTVGVVMRSACLQVYATLVLGMNA